MINDIIFKGNKPNYTQLLKYGFSENNGVYEYKTKMLDGFELSVKIASDKVETKLVDLDTNEEYYLHLVKDSQGEFVGKVRQVYEEILQDIYDKCYDKSEFKSEQANEIIEYIKNKYNSDLEFLWPKFPNNAIWRRKDTNKWFCLIVSLPKSKIGLEGDEIVEIIDLRMAPEKIEKVIDNKKFFKGYHMNKNSWITICLNNSVEIKEIFSLIDDSFELAVK